MDENPYLAPKEEGQEPPPPPRGNRLTRVLMTTAVAVAIYLLAYAWEQAQGQKPRSARLAVIALAAALLVAGVLSLARRATRS